MTKGGAAGVASVLIISFAALVWGVIYYRRKYRASDPGGEFANVQNQIVNGENGAREYVNPLYMQSKKVTSRESSREKITVSPDQLRRVGGAEALTHVLIDTDAEGLYAELPATVPISGVANAMYDATSTPRSFSEFRTPDGSPSNGSGGGTLPSYSHGQGQRERTNDGVSGGETTV